MQTWQNPDRIKKMWTPNTYNHIKYLRKDKLGSTTISLNDLRDWSNTWTAIPDEEDKMFVGTFEYEATPSKSFRIFLTTKRLISFAKYVSIQIIYCLIG